MAKIGRTEGKINLPDYIRALPILAFYAKVVNFVRYSGCIEKFLEAVLNLFRDRLSPMLKQIGVRDMQSIAGYWQKSRDSRCETGAQHGRNIPACNDNIISQ